MKKKNKVLLSSMATIVMSASLLAGGTYALFTSEASVDIAVTSGKVEVSATVKDGKITAGENNMGTASLDEETGAVVIEKMCPNDSFTFDIDVTNYSNVAAQYRTVVEATEDTGLADALTVKFTKQDGTEISFLGGYGVDNWALLEAVEENGEVVETITVTIEFVSQGDESDNKYNGDYGCKYQVRVEAVQGNAEVEDPITYDAEKNIYYVNNETGMRLMNGIIGSVSHGEDRAIDFALTDDMDMTGYVWTPLDMHWVNLDGQKHTVSNLNCGTDATGKSGFAGYAGATTVQNLTLENVTVAGEQAGIVAGQVEAGTYSVTIKGTNTVTYTDVAHYDEQWSGVGAVMGVNTTDPTQTDWKGITIDSGASIAVEYAGMVSLLAKSGNELCFNSAITVTNNGTVTANGDVYKLINDGFMEKSTGEYVITNKAGLYYFAETVNNQTSGTDQYNYNTVLLETDITFEDGEKWTPIGNVTSYLGITFKGEFDGQNHKIVNMQVEDFLENHAVASFFGSICGAHTVEGTDTASVKNLIIENPTVVSSHYASAVVGYTSCHNVTIENCCVVGGSIISTPELLADGKYDNGDKVGGIVACLNNDTTNVVKGCTVTGTKLQAYRDMGGIAGFSAGTLNNTKWKILRSCGITDMIIKQANILPQTIMT